MSDQTGAPLPGRVRAGTAAILCAFAGTLLMTGCGDDSDPNRVPLSGKVTHNGIPLVGADIRFFNDSDEVGMVTGEGGIYGIPIGALPGDYKVTISKLEGLENVPEGLAIAPDPSINKEQLPPQFSNRSNTKLQFTVPAEGTDAANFDLRTQ